MRIITRALPMRVVVYDEAGDVALDYHTQTDSVSLCPARLEKAQVKTCKIVIEVMDRLTFLHGQGYRYLLERLHRQTSFAR
jgi:hypothetical protein